MNYDPTDLETATRTVWGEARGEPPLGKQAVAWVIRNRAEDPRVDWWGNSIGEVCMWPWQFSCWNAKDPNYQKLLLLPRTDPDYKAIERICRDVFDGRLPDVTRGSNHYCVLGRKPVWSQGRVPQIVIGRHAFFKL